MKIIIEGHKYAQEDVRKYLWSGAFSDVLGNVSIGYVGYYYNPHIPDCVFILPKVLLEDVNGEELVFGKYKPEDILSIDENSPLDDIERKFIYEFSVWIHRAIVVFAKENPDSGIVLSNKQVSELGKGARRQSSTFLDILLALIQFNKDNRDFILFTLRNQHSGFNKINWNRTISHEQAFLQNGKPLYLRVQNKKRVINFDEELLVIYYSILNYIRDKYGFPVDIQVGFDLIAGPLFENYIAGYGCTRLRQIKYKYFSDITLQLWEMCYAFFEHAHKITIQAHDEQYLLVSSFEIVFEAMIDKLVGTKREELPEDLKDQPDGKRVDHLYQYKGLTNNEDDDRRIFYIGDSKYYKRRTQLGKEAVYKQYTYAKNVIQWNLNLFLDGDQDKIRAAQKTYKGLRQVRDDVTEGYDITPNFFISAKVNEQLNYDEQLTPVDNKQQTYNMRQFENRLFDRDTLLLAHYDVNFLHIVSLYARDNSIQQKEWQKKVREEFRSAIQEMLKDQYDFYAITAKEGVNDEQFLQANFQQLLGKVYAPYENNGTQKYYAVALDNDKEFAEENERVLAILEPYFYVKECELGVNPATILPQVTQPQAVHIPQSLLTMHYIQRYLSKNFLVGCYKDEAHLAWILGANDKNSNLYNVRIQSRDNKRDGALKRSQLEQCGVQFVILYKWDEDYKNEYRIFHVHHHAVMSAERMRQALYPGEPSGNYFCFVFDEEVKLAPAINVANLIAHARLNTSEPYIDGSPLILTGEQLMEYTK